MEWRPEIGRIRTIKPELPWSEKLGSVSRDARLSLILLLTLVDDSGRTRGAFRLLASQLFPFDDDAPKFIGGWMEELDKIGSVIVYIFDDNQFVQITNWIKHQKIDKPSPSRLPEFDEHSPKCWRVFANHSTPLPRTKDQVSSTLDLTPLPPKGETADAVATVQDSADSVTAAQFVMTSWNAVGPIRCSRLNDKLKASIKTRLRSPWWTEHWLQALEKVPDCGFLNGDGPRGWKADFAWFLKPDSVQEIIDGKYDTTAKPAAAPKSASTTRFENTISALEQWVADGTARHESLRQNDCPSLGSEVDH